MKSKHTPGPWAADGLDSPHDADRAIYARTPLHGNPIFVARAYGNGCLCPITPERVANARLIAAAPDLLEAAEKLIDSFMGLNYAFGTRSEEIAMLRAAIAKAKGE